MLASHPKASSERSAPEHLSGVGLEAGEAGWGRPPPPPESPEVSKEDLRHLDFGAAPCQLFDGPPFSVNPGEQPFLRASLGILERGGGDPLASQAKPFQVTDEETEAREGS